MFRFGTIGRGHNIYREFFRGLEQQSVGLSGAMDLDLPNIEDGIERMRLIANTMESARQGGRGVRLSAVTN